MSTPKVSYNVVDKNTHDILVDAILDGGIGYTGKSGEVHQIDEKYGGGGGGISGIAFCHISYDDETEEYVSSMTFTEINAAISADTVVFAASNTYPVAGCIFGAFIAGTAFVKAPVMSLSGGKWDIKITSADVITIDVESA